MTRKKVVVVVLLSLICRSYALWAQQRTSGSPSLVLSTTGQPTDNPSTVNKWVEAHVQGNAVPPAISTEDYTGGSWAVPLKRPPLWKALEAAEVKVKAHDDYREWKEIPAVSKKMYSLSITEIGTDPAADKSGETDRTWYRVNMKFKVAGKWMVKLKGSVTYTSTEGTVIGTATADHVLPTITADGPAMLEAAGGGKRVYLAEQAGAIGRIWRDEKNKNLYGSVYFPGVDDRKLIEDFTTKKYAHLLQSYNASLTGRYKFP